MNKTPSMFTLIRNTRLRMQFMKLSQAVAAAGITLDQMKVGAFSSVSRARLNTMISHRSCKLL